MGQETNLPWCDSTVNFWTGCTKVHEGCANCYAEEMMDARYGRVNWGPNNPRSVMANWQLPYTLNKRAKESGKRLVVFSQSLSDMFEVNYFQMIDHQKRKLFWKDGGGWTHDEKEFAKVNGAPIPLRMNDVRKKAFQVIEDCQNLTWIIFTKRPVEMMGNWPFTYVSCTQCSGKGVRRVADVGDEVPCVCIHDTIGFMRSPKKLKNVFIMFSISKQSHYDKLMTEFRVPLELASAQSMGVGLSVGPMLEKIDFKFDEYGYKEGAYPIKWIKMSGESGRNARPFDGDWALDAIQQGKGREGIAFYVQQMGDNPLVGGIRWSNETSKGMGITDIPQLIRVRDMPF